MKTRLSIPSLSIFSFVVMLTTPVIHADPVEDQIKEIRSRYEAIEGAKLRTKTFEFEGQDEPVSASCTLHYRGDEVVKIHLSHGSDHGARDEYYYYEGGNLFFVFATDGSWRFTGKTFKNGESETIDTAKEHRVYLIGGEVIRHLSKEASSTVPEQLPGLVAKAENQPSTDTERASQLRRLGRAALTIRSSADLEKAMFSE